MPQIAQILRSPYKPRHGIQLRFPKLGLTDRLTPLLLESLSRSEIGKKGLGDEVHRTIEQRSITSYHTPYTFSAKERDTETGYSYFGARYYDADISVWLSVDPMADKGPGISAYAYSFNNPVVFIDPNGEWPYPKSVQSAGFAFRMIWNSRLWIKSNVLHKGGSIQVRTAQGKEILSNPVRNNNKLCSHCIPQRELYANFAKGNHGDVNTHSSQDDQMTTRSENFYMYSGKTSSDYPHTGIIRDEDGEPTSIPILEEFPDGTVSFRAEFRREHGLSRKDQPLINSTGDVIVKGTGQVVYKKPTGLAIGDNIEDRGGQIIVSRGNGSIQYDVTEKVLNSLP